MTGAGGAGVDARPGWRWDVALSFASAQRDYVEKVASALKARGVRCFYDADEQIELWGKYLAEELPGIYGEQAAAVVVFVSAEYAARDWTRLERRAALNRAVRERREYVLPARFDDTPLPGLLSDMVAVDLRSRTAEQFAAMIADKLALLVITASVPAAVAVQQAQAIRGLAAGRPLAEVTDPFALEVHRPVQLDQPQPDMPTLPTYVTREHDAALRQVVQAAVEGCSAIVVLVGGSSTGKTRACWEALGPLRDHAEPWRLWHPIEPSRPEAALRELSAIGPRTVVWLNEAQFYLNIPDGLGERVAAGLRELLRDPTRAPVLVLATLWPDFWDELTARPPDGDDPHAQARELLAGGDITVPATFTAAQLQELSQAWDARLAQAAAAQDGQVIQFLAGAPELLTRYRNAPPAAMALIHTAMDARRLGMGAGLPQAFLEAAAPDYLTDAEWDALGEDWLKRALAYLAVPCKGVRGPLTRIRPRPAGSGTTSPRSRVSHGQLAQYRLDSAGAPVYRLADYLDQYGRRHRKGHLPPTDFWVAVADHASSHDQTRLGFAAHGRGLFRIAAQLNKNAATSGNRDAIVYLSRAALYRGADVPPLSWAAAHVPLHDPDTASRLLDSLRTAGARDQVTAMLHRDPAAHVSLENLNAVVRLLTRLRMVDAHHQVATLARRAAAQAPLLTVRCG
jgi:TIR domain